MTMTARLLALLVIAYSHAAAVAAPAAVPYKIVTASERGTYIQIGRDLAKFVAPAANIELEVLPSAGSAENVQRLRFEPGVKFALVQSDVYQAFLDLAAGGNAEAGEMIRPLRVIMPLYNEEIYFIVRSNSPLNFVHEIKDAKINVGRCAAAQRCRQRRFIANCSAQRSRTRMRRFSATRMPSSSWSATRVWTWWWRSEVSRSSFWLT
jgi:TRAP-type uncharacterized transport system substrate-binding protein